MLNTASISRFSEPGAPCWCRLFYCRYVPGYTVNIENLLAEKCRTSGPAIDDFSPLEIGNRSNIGIGMRIDEHETEAKAGDVTDALAPALELPLFPHKLL